MVVLLIYLYFFQSLLVKLVSVEISEKCEKGHKKPPFSEQSLKLTIFQIIMPDIIVVSSCYACHAFFVKSYALKIDEPKYFNTQCK